MQYMPEAEENTGHYEKRTELLYPSVNISGSMSFAGLLLIGQPLLLLQTFRNDWFRE